MIISGLIIALTVLLINSGFLLRTLALYGKLIGDTSFFKITNNYHSPLMTLTNVVAELFNQLQTPFSILNSITKIVFIFFSAIISTIDPKVSIQNLDSFLNNISMPSEDTAVNTIHTIFIFLSITYGIKFFIKKQLFKKYSWSIFLSVITISTLFVWTQFNTRYFLSLFIVISPIIGIISEKYINKMLIKIFFIIFLLTSVLYLTYNMSKPINMIFSKKEGLYYNQYLDPNYVIAYKQLANIIIKNKYKNIGLNFEELFFEYPLWVYLNDWGVKDFRIEHIDVRNQTGKIKINNFKPDVIIMCDYCFKDVPKYNRIYSKWAKVKYKVPYLPYFTLYGR